LARWQAEWVAARLAKHRTTVELVPITTSGDANQISSLGQISPTPGVFTKELQRALLDERIDLAVHSLKDLPTAPVPGLILAATPPRESPRDVLVSRSGATLSDLPLGSVIGTGSQRRRAQLLHIRPDLVVRDIRGNVETRLQKMRQGDFDAIVLAEAGLTRLGFADQITEVFDPETILPAVGQGALGIECRTKDSVTRGLLSVIDEPITHAAVLAERTLLAELLGGCLAPVGALAEKDGDQLRLRGVVISLDGKTRLFAEHRDHLSEPETLGRWVARLLLDQGAAKIIAAARAH
jgi:hydroxymethylbilane synthase